MRLLVVAPGVPEERSASQEVYGEYVSGLRAAGIEVQVLSLGDFGLTRGIVNGDFIQRMRFNIKIERMIQDEVYSTASYYFKPDHILCFDLLSAWAAQTCSGPKTIWLGDLNFQTEIYHAWYAFLENWRAFPGIPLTCWHSRIWKRIYKDVLAGARVLTCAASSVGELAKLGIAAQYEPFAWPNEGEPIAKKLPAKPTFLFYGQLSGGLGSRSSFHFLKDLYPYLLEQWGPGGFEIQTAGSGELPAWVIDYWYLDRPELIFLGWVDNLDEVMAKVHAVLVPISAPIGNRSRIITAWAKKCLVIAHANCALGNPDLEDGETGYLAKTPAEFAVCMKWAADPGLTAKKLVDYSIDNAHDIYMEKFRPEAAVARMAEIINSGSPIVFGNKFFGNTSGISIAGSR